MSPRTVMRYVEKGKLPAGRTLGGYLRFRPEDIDAVLREMVP